MADNHRVLRLINLLHFNIFDLDAFGSPWEQAYIVSARRTLSPGERFGLVITDGSSLNLRFGAFPTALGLLANISHKASGLAKHQAKIIDSALDSVAARLGGSIVERWQARGKKGSSMRYIGLVLEGHKKSPGR